MWLINTATYQLEDYGEANEATYAILSHRWEVEEVSFLQIQDPKYMKKIAPSSTSWLKIKAFCYLAASRGIPYAWVDTCCIDKSSSAELSESINSMFKWYQRSTVCIVYLRDASFDVEESFKSSEWFSRGWTLQELLAPKYLEFFDRDWRYLGTRTQLCKMICSATNIPLTTIYNPYLYPTTSYCVAERMRWAASRKTTRCEDTAYCLLGLFEVNMPLLYGEGSKSAFQRLQREILQNSDDESIFAWSMGIFEDGGALAQSPAYFGSSSGISIVKQEMERKPYSMTNKGLQIELELCAAPQIGLRRETIFGEEIFIAPLRCMKENKRLCIGLVRSPTSVLKWHRVRIYMTPLSMPPGEKREVIITPWDAGERRHLFLERPGAYPDAMIPLYGSVASQIREHLSHIDNRQLEPHLDVLDMEPLLETSVNVQLLKLPACVLNFQATLPVLESLGLPNDLLEKYRKSCEGLLQRRDSLYPKGG